MWRTWLRRLLGRPAPPSTLTRFAELAPGQRRLVVGLGNPGGTYAATRHNVGFRCVDRLVEELGGSWEDARPQAEALIALVFDGERGLLLAKPHTFMNASGRAVRDLVAASQVALGQVLIVYDDMDLPLGALRLRARGSPGTHNGMRSVAAELDAVDVPRLRIGIGQAGATDARDYVLGGFAPDESALAETATAEAAAACRLWVAQGVTAAMNAYNGKSLAPSR